MPERYLGRTLGKFRIDAVVGSGGFAWVYKAFDPELEIPVALKVLKPQYAGDEKFEQRFRREASTAARLRHPNIIKIFAVGKDHDAVYFAMDFLPQGLPDRLEVIPTLPEPVLIRLGIDVASALGFAHREGVIHRDIKTDNILFDEHGNAIVADFGIARAVSNYAQQTGTNMVVGTPQYFSPEQARGLTLDGRADLYSLGVTLYRAATGVLPFTGEDWYEIARQHVEDRPRKPREHNPSLSKGMERVILTLLEKDPGDRYQTGEAVCQALGALLTEKGETIAMRATPTPTIDGPTSPTPPPWEVAKRRRRRVVQGTAIVAVLLALGSAYTLRRQHTPVRTASSAPAASTPSSPANSSPAPASEPSHGSPVASAKPPVPTAPTPAPAKPVVHITAPANAQLSVAGTVVGTGEFHTDTLKPGRYEILATLPDSGDQPCPTLRVTTTITVPATGTTTARLSPRGCGVLVLDAQPNGAEYNFRPIGGGDEVASGHTPTGGPITLPIGAYTLAVSARYCATYSDTVHVTEEAAGAAARHVRVRLVCGT
ncbi:MAG TPA: protein kinase [Gemmatimonadaceae bacterium]|nr:protein kinase [Gemmatimonadaceae bacterium]